MRVYANIASETAFAPGGRVIIRVVSIVFIHITPLRVLLTLLRTTHEPPSSSNAVAEDTSTETLSSQAALQSLVQRGVEANSSGLEATAVEREGAGIQRPHSCI